MRRTTRMAATALYAALGWVGVSQAAQPALADTLCVGGAKHRCFSTIQAAVDAAQDGDTIDVRPGTYAGGITIDKDLALVGASAGATTIAGGGPVITIGFGAVKPAVSISGVTITGGVNDSSGFAAGGGVKVDPAPDNSTGAAVRISDSVIAGNVAEPKSTFSSPAPCGSVPFDECAFAAGGGIDNAGSLTVTRTRISGNRAGGGVTMYGFGGGIANHPQGTLTLRRSAVTGNRAVVTVPNGRFTDGGGIADNGVLQIENSVVGGNTSVVTSSVASTFPFDVQQIANAGGIYITGSATITGSSISGNKVDASNAVGDAQAAAGGIDQDGSLLLRHSRLNDNQVRAGVPPASSSSTIATNGGIEGQGDTTVHDSLITGNSITALSPAGTVIAAGGGLGNTGLTTMQRTLVIGNRVTANGSGGSVVGGGIFNISLGGPAQLTLLDSVVTANTLNANPAITPLGGGIFNDAAFTLTRTIVARNHPDQCYGC
jgi:hypothetical protein